MRDVGVCDVPDMDPEFPIAKKEEERREKKGKGEGKKEGGGGGEKLTLADLG